MMCFYIPTDDPSALYDPGRFNTILRTRKENMLEVNHSCLYAGEDAGQCSTSLPDANTATAHALARDLTVILYPIGRDKRFSLYVSWESHYDRESETYCNCTP